MNDIHLRELEIADMPRLNAWRNDPEVIKYLGANFLFISPAIDEKWFESYLASRASAIRLAIVFTELNLCIGVVNLTSIHAINRSAEFSIMLGDKDYWSRGFGRIATNQIIRHGFEDINLNRIYLTVLETNARAQKLYEGVGFKTEGIQREAVYKEGVFHDMISMALLKSDFLRVNE